VLPESSGHRMAQQVEERLRERGLESVVEVEVTERGVALRIRDAVLFESGSDLLRDSARPLLSQIAELSTEFTHDLAIEGHTDDRPIHTVRFPSNWELSAGRAASVVRLFENAGIDPIRLAAIGLGEHRPVGNNETVEGRNRNRRVVIVILANDQQLPEQFARDDGAEPSSGDDTQGTGASGAEGAL